MNSRGGYDESVLRSKVDAWKEKNQWQGSHVRASSTPSGAAVGYVLVALTAFIMGLAFGWLGVAPFFPLTHS